MQKRYCEECGEMIDNTEDFLCERCYAYDHETEWNADIDDYYRDFLRDSGEEEDDD